ncbi:hypothetical protein Y032_0263g585 [Ancylostoma ceylanicum]|nr:hypothetical protein Y032_0263g585 [Ancylostoma ceylanicum]
MKTHFSEDRSCDVTDQILKSESSTGIVLDLILILCSRGVNLQLYYYIKMRTGRNYGLYTHQFLLDVRLLAPFFNHPAI